MFQLLVAIQILLPFISLFFTLLHLVCPSFSLLTQRHASNEVGKLQEPDNEIYTILTQETFIMKLHHNFMHPTPISIYYVDNVNIRSSPMKWLNTHALVVPVKCYPCGMCIKCIQLLEHAHGNEEKF